MPCINIPLDPIGPLIEIGISYPSSQLSQGDPEPPIRWIRAVADTGCSHTSVHSSIAAACELPIISVGRAHTPGGVVTTNIYHGDLLLRPVIGHGPFEWRFWDRQFIEMVNPNPEFEALLGMDVLSQGMFVVNG